MPAVSTNPKRTVILLAAGTAVALLAGGVLLQVIRSESVNAGSERNTAGTSNAAGVARISTPSGAPQHLARVNGQLISYDDVAQECMARYGGSVLDKIIDRTLIQQACEKKGIVITPAEVDAEIVKIAKRFELDVENWMKMLQMEREITPQEYRRDIIWPMLALKKLAGEDVEVTDQDLQKAFIRDYGEKVKARMIMFDNIRRAQNAWEEMKKEPTQEKFEQMAREHSVEPNSRALSGAIPPIRRYAGNDELENQAFRLKNGEMSGIIQVGLNRYAILRCEGRTEKIVEFDEVKNDVREHVVETKVQESVARVFSTLKKDAEIHNFLTNTSTGGSSVSSKPAGNRQSSAGPRGVVQTGAELTPSETTPSRE